MGKVKTTVHKDPKPKTRKRRQMSAEQKAAAVERLAKARAAKGKTENKSIHVEVRNLPDDAMLSLVNVKGWIKTNEEKLKGMKAYKNSSDSKERTQYQRVEIYLSNMKAYLREGTWNDLFYGEHQQNEMKYVCHAMAYDSEGVPKRTVNTFYPDIGGFWTKEMDIEDRFKRGLCDQNGFTLHSLTKKKARKK